VASLGTTTTLLGSSDGADGAPDEGLADAGGRAGLLADSARSRPLARRETDGGTTADTLVLDTNVVCKELPFQNTCELG